MHRLRSLPLCLRSLPLPLPLPILRLSSPSLSPSAFPPPPRLCLLSRARRLPPLPYRAFASSPPPPPPPPPPPRSSEDGGDDYQQQMDHRTQGMGADTQGGHSAPLSAPAPAPPPPASSSASVPSPLSSSLAAAPILPLPPPSAHSSHAYFHRSQLHPSSPSPSSSSSASASASAAPLYEMANDLTNHFLQALHLSEQNRFVKGIALGLSVLGVVLLSAYLFRDSVKTSTAEQVADVAKRSLADSDVQEQVNSLSQEVVHRLLTDPAVLSTALAFSTRLLHEQSTQTALSSLLSSLLHDPSTLVQARDFSTQLIHSLTSSESVQRMTAELVKGAIAQPDNKAQLIGLLQAVVNDERSLAELRRVGSASAHDVLNDRSVQEHMTTFVKQCLSDPSLQQTAGEALWGAVRYSFRPKWGNGRAEVHPIQTTMTSTPLPSEPPTTLPPISPPTLPHYSAVVDSAPTEPLHPAAAPFLILNRAPHQLGRPGGDERMHDQSDAQHDSQSQSQSQPQSPLQSQPQLYSPPLQRSEQHPQPQQQSPPSALSPPPPLPEAADAATAGADSASPLSLLTPALTTFAVASVDEETNSRSSSDSDRDTAETAETLLAPTFTITVNHAPS